MYLSARTFRKIPMWLAAPRTAAGRGPCGPRCVRHSACTSERGIFPRRSCSRSTCAGHCAGLLRRVPAHFRGAHAAFEAAHALKGVLGNLSLTSIYAPIVEITELLRNNTDMDYTSLLSNILEKKDELGRLCADY